MSYISQGIVFVLAIMGILFKSTKTDKDGKTIYTKSGVPVLTMTGMIVILLLTLSFAISLWTTWGKAKSDDKQKNDAQEAQASLTKKLTDANQQIEDLRAEFTKTGQQLLEEKVREISAVVTYGFDGEVLAQQHSLPPNILERGVQLEIIGIIPNKFSLQSLPNGWVDGFLLKNEDLHLTASEQSFDSRSTPSTAGPYIEQIRTFSNFHGDLKEFDKLASWNGAILEGRLKAAPLNPWLYSLVSQSDESRQKAFDRYYGITAATREAWSNTDTTITPIPVTVKLELFINKRRLRTEGEWKGWLAKATEGDEDVRNLCVIKLPVVRANLP